MSIEIIGPPIFTTKVLFARLLILISYREYQPKYKHMQVQVRAFAPLSIFDLMNLPSDVSVAIAITSNRFVCMHINSKCGG